jgi:hypothetical protein
MRLILSDQEDDRNIYKKITEQFNHDRILPSRKILPNEEVRFNITTNEAFVIHLRDTTLGIQGMLQSLLQLKENSMDWI